MRAAIRGSTRPPKGMATTTRTRELLRNANGQVIVDPVSLDGVRRGRGVKVGPHVFNSRTLRTLLERNQFATNPLTRQPFPSNIYTKYRPRPASPWSSPGYESTSPRWNGGSPALPGNSPRWSRNSSPGYETTSPRWSGSPGSNRGGDNYLRQWTTQFGADGLRGMHRTLWNAALRLAQELERTSRNAAVQRVGQEFPVLIDREDMGEGYTVYGITSRHTPDNARATVQIDGDGAQIMSIHVAVYNASHTQ